MEPNKPKLLMGDDEAIRTQLKYALRDDFTLLFAEDEKTPSVPSSSGPSTITRSRSSSTS